MQYSKDKTAIFLINKLKKQIEKDCLAKFCKDNHLNYEYTRRFIYDSKAKSVPLMIKLLEAFDYKAEYIETFKFTKKKKPS